MRIEPRLVDRLLASAVFLIGTVEALVSEQRGGPWLNVLWIALIAATVHERRRRPVLPVAIAWGALVISRAGLLAPPTQESIGWIAAVLLAFAFGRHQDRRPALGALAAMLAAIELMYLVAPSNEPSDLFFPIVILTLIWGAGRTLRSHAAVTAELAELAISAEERSSQELAEAQARERRRLAREMHDVIAHSLSLMVVQAGGARRILAQDPRRAAEAARHVEETGRQSLGELRRLLGVLGGDVPDASNAPAPGLAGLSSLIERARAGGLLVTLHQHGTPRELPAGLDLAAYRIVQEALTNALRHAGPVRAEVALTWAPSMLEIDVSNEAGDPGLRVGGSGHGLIGMQERTALYGGSFDAGPLAGGGFGVHATLQTSNPGVAA